MLKTRGLYRTIDATSMMAATEPALTIAPNAVRRIRYLRQKESKPDGALRMRIIAGGCSGMQYRMDMADAPRTSDIVVTEEDVKVFVDPKSMAYLKGSTLDYEEDLLGGQFKIVNPNAKHSCSCGLSFTI